MSLEGATKLTYALKTLRREWDVAQQDWHDRVRHDFERTVIQVIDDRVSATVHAMHKLAEVHTRVQRECGQGDGF